tara:strand:- start:1165 stop:1449 length:285 start_codon:yes stop_codon:yes gene_type:complete
MKTRGRPLDKDEYVDFFWDKMNMSNVEDCTKDSMSSTISKLNSKEILNLCALICNSKGVELSEFSRGIPSNTPAQMKRYKNVLELYTSIKKNRS